MAIKKRLIPINFAAPWWQVIWNQKPALFAVMFGEILVNVFETISPILLAYLFSYHRYDYFLYFIALWLVVILFQDFIRKINALFELSCIHSIHFSAQQYLLTIDPVFHAHRESGAILAKIERASRSYEMLLDAVIVDILGYAAGIVTALISLSQESFLLSCVLLGLLLVIMGLNIKLAQLFIIPREAQLLLADDVVKTSGQENLAQVHLIRSYFATDQVNKKMYKDDEHLLEQERILWNTNISMWSTIKILYLITVFILGSYLLNSINLGTIDVITGISLMVMYIQGTYGIISIERPMRVAFKSVTRIKDLFTFISKFGKQTFPVLDEDHLYSATAVASATISVVAHNISFSYNHHVKIFDKHSLSLVVPQQQEIKLYGIIGPSGIGKSTLLLMLGGQLQPTTGTVVINGINIYTVSDATRKSLIAVQGQTASNMRGNLRSNLLFGLPEKQIMYDDNYLVDILMRVGLWNIFKIKSGLATLIGEGGLTLSGGQRQRLNFASLFLRAGYYKPSLILIDEPTSSLDEVSEQAITDMIVELSHNALTLVIAHRLKTIKHAQGILDFSLIAHKKEIEFFSEQELAEKSAYYQKLLGGAISWDE